jgi:hypothetical protein
MHPIWNWSKREVVDAIAKAGLKLSGERGVEKGLL